MKPRVLFADDQIPWPKDSESKNVLVKQELIQQLGDKLKSEGKDPPTVVDENRLWFERLHNTLSVDFEVIPAREYKDAEHILGVSSEASSFDLAVIDLSWWGDAGRKGKSRKNIGFDLLHKLAERYKKTKKSIPAIAFSQNFEDDPTLLAKALKLGALPIPKNYTRTKDDKYPGHQAVAAAIEYLLAIHPRSADSPKLFISHRHKEEIARALVAVLQSAFHIGQADIRCTSVYPYGLPMGESIPDRLKLELKCAQAVIGILTPDTRESSYVLFELGGAWAQNILTCPMLARGASRADLPDPIQNINFLSLEDERDCHQFIDDLENLTTLERQTRVGDDVAERIRKLVEQAKKK